jgi:hypothetical protein
MSSADAQRRYAALRTAGYTGVISANGYPDDRRSANYFKWFRIALAATTQPTGGK